MFAQQIINQHTRANQPMGILASSPQLMGAVQRFKDGGAVKGYDAGGGFFKNYSTSPLANMLESIAGPKFKKGSEGETLANIAQRSLQSDVSPVIPGANQIAVNPNQFEVNRRQVSTTKEKSKGIDGEVTTSGNIEDQLKKSNKDKGTIDFETTPSKFEDIDPSAIINDKNKKALDKEKKADTSDPSKGDFEAGTTTPKFKELRDAKDKLAKVQETINKPDPGAPVVQEFKGVLDEIQTELNKKGKELTAEEVDKQARKYAGLEDNADYDDDKHTAFWMALIKGGLATAAGESSNALTNIAKGLSIGVDAYGKDISNINAQEREDRKALGEARYKVIKDSKNEQLALRTAKVQYLQNKAQLLQSSEQFKESMDFKRVQEANNTAFRSATFEVQMFQAINNANIAGETLELKKQTLAQDKDLREKTLDATIKSLESKERMNLLGEDAKRVLALGDEYATYKDGKLKVTDDGRELLETFMMSKATGKLTDLMQTVKDAKESLTVGGVKFKDAKSAKTGAFLYYKGGYADRIGKAKADVTSGKSEADIIKEIKEEFAKASGGSNAIVLD